MTDYLLWTGEFGWRPRPSANLLHKPFHSALSKPVKNVWGSKLKMVATAIFDFKTLFHFFTIWAIIIKFGGHGPILKLIWNTVTTKNGILLKFTTPSSISWSEHRLINLVQKFLVFRTSLLKFLTLQLVIWYIQDDCIRHLDLFDYMTSLLQINCECYFLDVIGKDITTKSNIAAYAILNL